jgi:catechol 2,3-dioxygenase-like lactoylglutathione lyase family enzyme
MVRDVAASLKFYEQLHFRTVFRDVDDKPMYSVVRRDAVELHLQWHDAREWNYPNDRPTYRFYVDKVDELADELSKLDGLDATPVADTGWGTREFHLRDPDGNGLQFYKDL